MDIIFSTLDRSEVLALPCAPVGGLSINDPQNNETLSGLSWDINVIGNMGLKTVSVKGTFYARRLAFTSPYSSAEPFSYVRFFERHRGRDKPPLRIVISDVGGGEVLNMPCTVDAFEWSPTKLGDLTYSMTVRQYEFVVD